MQPSMPPPNHHPWVSPREIEQHDWLIENAKDGSLLVLVPGGKFLAGSSGSDEGGGEPFEVDIPAFYLGLTCVTNRQYARFLSETVPSSTDLQKWLLLDSDCYVRKTGAERFEAHGGREEHPVVQVSWFGAEAYCRWAELHLPSELQWEKGARYRDGRRYPWGRDWSESKCRNKKNKSNGQTASVWEYPAGTSEWGGYQLSGNVWEWCADWYDPDAYNRYRTGDLKPPSQDTRRVVRGGSWYDVSPDSFTTSLRNDRDPVYRDIYTGFRCMCETVRPPRAGG